MDVDHKDRDAGRRAELLAKAGAAEAVKTLRPVDAALEAALARWDGMFALGLSDQRASHVRSGLVSAAAANPPAPGTEWPFVMAAGLVRLYESFLADGIAPEAAYANARAALRAPFESPEGLVSYLRLRYGVDRDQPADAFHQAGVRFKARGEEVWGPGFRYEQDVLDPDRSFVNITRCFFHDYLRRAGRPELTRIVCEIDVLFADELSKPRYGVRFERPTAMGMGGDVCRFQFTRVARPSPRSPLR